MTAETLTYLCLSFRGSERVATDAGARLDAVRHPEPVFAALLARLWPEGQGQALGEAPRRALQEARATAIFGAQLERVFSSVRAFPGVPDEVLDLKIDRVQGRFRVMAAIAARSAPADLDGVEGDDLLLVLALAPTDETATQMLHQRFSSQQALLEYLAGWRWPGLDWSGVGAVFGNRFRPGTYLVGECEKVEGGQLLAHACATAYFYYCWLVCQRTERNLLAVHVNGDWDEEYRRLLLVRKQLVAARKTALLKNRAFPGSSLLVHDLRCLEVFRLEMQLAYLTEQAEETTKALEMHNTYRTTGRIQSIELIVFLSTILGLGLAINALQMRPFFDAETDNALGRPIFWWVFGIVVGVGLLLLGLLSHWSRTRKLLRWLRRFFTRSHHD